MARWRYPRLDVSWTASNLNDSFGGYYVFVRPSRAQAKPWELAAYISVPPGRSRSQIEDNHTKVSLATLGWEGQQGSKWYEGWDISVCAYDRVKKKLQNISTPDITRQALTGDDRP